MNIEEMFKTELNYIKDEKLRKALIELLKILPDYWYRVPASSTGKYHPEYALGESGLLRHSKAAMRIGYELLCDPSIGGKYAEHERDLMLLSLLVHDGLKSGNPEEKYTRFDHPILMANYVLENASKIGLNEEDAKFCADVIKTHMGDWTVDYNGNEILEKPKTKYQNFVHMADYLASRKCLLVPFNGNDISV